MATFILSKEKHNAVQKKFRQGKVEDARAVFAIIMKLPTAFHLYTYVQNIEKAVASMPET
jgi:hypothetical protein